MMSDIIVSPHLFDSLDTSEPPDLAGSGIDWSMVEPWSSTTDPYTDRWISLPFYFARRQPEVVMVECYRRFGRKDGKWSAWKPTKSLVDQMIQALHVYPVHGLPRELAHKLWKHRKKSWVERVDMTSEVKITHDPYFAADAKLCVDEIIDPMDFELAKADIQARKRYGRATDYLYLRPGRIKKDIYTRSNRLMVDGNMNITFLKNTGDISTTIMDDPIYDRLGVDLWPPGATNKPPIGSLYRRSFIASDA